MRLASSQPHAPVHALHHTPPVECGLKLDPDVKVADDRLPAPAAVDDIVSGQVLDVCASDDEDGDYTNDARPISTSSQNNHHHHHHHHHQMPELVRRGRSQLHVLTRTANADMRHRTRAHSESDRQNYDPQTGELVSRSRRTAARSYRRGEARYPLLQITVDELARDGLGPFSLVNDSTALDSTALVSPTGDSPPATSPVVPQTIPEHEQLSPRNASLPETAKVGLRSASDASAGYSRRSVRRSNSGLVGSTASLGGSSSTGGSNSSRPRRRTSTQSTSPSSSPASAFLSKWTDSKSALADPDAFGEKFGDGGRYTIGRQIGYGGFSVIKEVSVAGADDSTAPRLAVKIVRKLAPGKGGHDNERFQLGVQHEVDVWRRLRHRNVLPLLDYHETSFARFCVMPLLTGGTLLDLVHRHRSASGRASAESPRRLGSGIPPHVIKDYIGQVAAALHYLHVEMRMAHHDVKLENCLLDGAGNVLLCDFGMADYFDVDAARPTSGSSSLGGSIGGGGDGSSNGLASGSDSSSDDDDNDDDDDDGRVGPSETSTSVTGSLHSASPELLRAARPLYRPSVDMWAFGVLCYTLVVGHAPFRCAFAPKLLMMILRGDFDRDAVRQAADAPASELVNGCMDRDARRRWTISQVVTSRYLQG